MSNENKYIDKDGKIDLPDELFDNKNCTLLDLPIPTKEDLESEEFNKIWNVIKTWDINVPEYYEGYTGATGSHVMLILNGLNEKKEK